MDMDADQWLIDIEDKADAVLKSRGDVNAEFEATLYERNLEYLRPLSKESPCPKN